MPLSVRKSICLTPGALLLSLTLSFAAALAEAPKKNVQVKTLDDNREVLRPIPAVLKPARIKPEGKAEAKTATKPESKSEAKSDAKTKTETKIDSKAGAKAEPKPDSKTAAKAAEKTLEKTAAKAETKTETKKTLLRKRVASGGAHFVPPPPPVTPTMMGDGADYAFFSGMPLEMLSKDALKDRAKEISIQYKDACRELADHNVAKQDKIQRAKDFVGLYQEGVVSRRELETSQKEADEVNSDIDRLTFKVKELKGLLDRINKRLSPPVAKKSARKLIN